MRIVLVDLPIVYRRLWHASELEPMGDGPPSRRDHRRAPTRCTAPLVAPNAGASMKDAKCPTQGCHAITGGAKCKRCQKARKPSGTIAIVRTETWLAPGGRA